MATRANRTPDFARQELAGIDQARERLAGRMHSPWWYKLGAAACAAMLFVAMGLLDRAEPTAMALVILGAIIAPPALLAALKRSTGVAVDRYANGLGSWYAVFFSMLAIAFILYLTLDLTQPFFVAAGIAFVATLVAERHIDGVLQRRMLAGQRDAR